MDMLKCFFSNEYAGRGDIFDGLSIWEDEKYRNLQGTYPVIFLSFAGIKQTSYDQARKALNQKLTDIYNPWSITKYLSTGKLDTYWANTSANGLVGKLIRESGFGRYDVIMEPKDKNKVAVIIEFKVYDKEYDN